MVLLANGVAVVADELLDCTEVQTATAAFLQQPAVVPPGEKTIYACQGEEATCTADEAAWLASSDATTCIVAVVVVAPDVASSSPAGGAAVAAPGGASTAGSRHSGLARVVHHDEGTPLGATLAGLGCSTARLWLAGGYDDVGGKGRALTASLLRCLERSAARLHVQLACLGPQNTAADGSPRATALAVDLRTQTARPAAPHPPQSRGPLLSARMAQWAYSAALCGGSGEEGGCGEVEGGGRHPLRRVYDAAAQQMELTLWQGRPSPDVLWYAGRMLQLPDEMLLQQCSTSPAHEPPHFTEDMRAAFGWLLQQSEPAQLATHRFAWTPNGWQVAAEGEGAAAAGSAAQALPAVLLRGAEPAARQAAGSSRLCT